MEELTLQRIKLLKERVNHYSNDPTKIPQDERRELSLMFAVAFKDFKDFCEIGMRFLGFGITEMQLSIADYVQNGPKKRMVQAQRG